MALTAGQLADGRAFLHGVRTDRVPSERRCHIVPGEDRASPVRTSKALCGALAPLRWRAGWDWVPDPVTCSKCADKAARIAAGRDRSDMRRQPDWRVKAKRPPHRGEVTPQQRVTELKAQVRELRRALAAERAERVRLEGLIDDLEQDNATLFALYERAGGLDAQVQRKTTLSADERVVARTVAMILRGPDGRA